MRQFATELRGVFLIAYLERYQFDFKVGKKRKVGRETFFLLNVYGFCREKNFKNSARLSQNSGHLVQPVQLFESTNFRDY